MKFLIDNARILKWTSLVIAILAFAARIFYGEKYESHSTRTVTGETRMDGSTFAVWMIIVICVAMLSFAIFNELAKRKK